MRKSKIAAAAVYLIAVAVSPAFAADQVKLEWKWKEGETNRYRMKMDSDIRMEMPNMPGGAAMPGMEGGMKIRQTQEFLMSEKVKEISPEGTATIEQTIESAKMEMDQGPMAKVSYDSTKPATAEGEAAKMMQPLAWLVGKSFTFVRDKTGQIVEIRGMEDLLNSLMDEIRKETQGNPMSAMIVSQVEKMFSEENFDSLNQCSFEALPTEAVGPGSKWQSSTSQTVPMMGQLTRDTTYTFEGFEALDAHKCAKIAFTFKAASSQEGLANNPFAQFMEIKSMTMEGNGNLFFAPKEGCVLKQTTDTTLDMEMAMRLPAGAPQDRPSSDMRPTTMKQHIVMKMALERVE